MSMMRCMMGTKTSLISVIELVKLCSFSKYFFRVERKR
jgi:hypothetical protein